MIAAVAAAALLAHGPYTAERIEGWLVRVDQKVHTEPQAWATARKELQTQLYRIAHVVPDEPLAKLRRVEIWVHATSPGTRCMAYHPGAQWLRDHDMNPEMEHDIEIGSVATFVEWTYEQPWMVLHELAHAYHDRFLPGGFENPDVLSAFTRARDSKTYESVVHWNGRDTRHYALTNQMEYFAEATEAYFGQNDFYPFVRAELMRHDPEGLKLMEKVWGKPQKRR